MFQRSQILRLPELSSDRPPEHVVLEVISGGMGMCVKVQHRESGDLLALKVLKPEFASDRVARRRFAAEGRTWMLLANLPGVVPAWGIVSWNELPLIASDWMGGGDLRRRMQTQEPETYFRTIMSIAATLKASVDRYAVVHRDIKPSNILFDEAGQAHIADWGIAKGVADGLSSQQGSPAESSQLTQAGQFLGTPLYAAPAQFVDASTVDWRADLYSLGCILYEWETGHPPFLGSLREIAEGHLRVAPPRVGHRFSKGRFRTATVVRRCLEKRPEDRYRSYDEFLDAMEACATRLGLVARRPPPPAPTHPPIRSADGRYAIGEAPEELAEAQALMGFGRHREAAEIYRRFFIPQLLKPGGAWHFGHILGLNYATCLGSSQADQTSAVQVYRMLSQASAKPAEFYLNYSQALLRGEMLESAEEVAREGHVRFPGDPELLGNLLIALTHQGKFSEAFTLVPRRLEGNRDLAALRDVAVLHQAAARKSVEDWPTAARWLKTALELLTEAQRINPRASEVLYIRAQVLRELFRFREASDDVQALIESADERGFVEAAAALQMQLLADMGASEAAFSFESKWLPHMVDESAKVRLERVRARMLTDDHMIGKEVDGERLLIPEVIRFYEDQVQRSLHPTVDDFIELARIYEWMGRREEAFALIDRALKRWPRHWRTLMNRSYFHSRAGQIDDAERAALAAVESAPHRPEPLDALALFYGQVGQTARAKATKARADSVFEDRKRIAR